MPNTFKGTSIQRTDRSVWFDVRRGLKELPKVAGKTTIIPSARGGIPRNRVARSLDIELYGWIKGSSWSQYWTLVKEILALFDPEDGEGTLSVPLDDGTTATIEAQPVFVLPEGNEALGATQHFAIQLEAVDPPNWTFT